MAFFAIFSNYVLIPALISWSIAQVVKVLLEYFHSHCWDWSLLLRAGGMPSSHTALITGMTHALGLELGFNSPVYAVGFVLSMVVIYDATGIRRQAGRHAKIINQMITDLATGHPLKEELLREVLGHTPLEALAGVLLGLVVSQVYWLIFR
jgi:hypothetical protein